VAGLFDGGDSRHVRNRHGPPRPVILPIGAYEPRWFTRERHMNQPRSACASFVYLKSNSR